MLLPFLVYRAATLLVRRRRQKFSPNIAACFGVAVYFAQTISPQSPKISIVEPDFGHTGCHRRPCSNGAILDVGNASCTVGGRQMRGMMHLETARIVLISVSCRTNGEDDPGLLLQLLFIRIKHPVVHTVVCVGAALE